MYYKARDIPLLLRTSTGRKELRGGAFKVLWPILLPIARLWRRTGARRTRVAAVIGSAGKTSTTKMVAAVLCGGDYRVPPGNCLSYTAAAILGIRCRDVHAVMEVGIAFSGQMAMYAPVVRPDVVVVTAIGSDHTGGLGGLHGARREKVEMVRALRPGGVAVLNGDDPNVMWMADRTRAKVVTFGFGEDCDVRADEMTMTALPPGTRFRLHAGGEVRDVRIRLLGRPMVYAALAAVAAGLAEGLKADTIVSRIEQVDPAPRRLEPVRLRCGAILLQDAHKSSIETVEAALDVLAELPARRRIFLLGEVDDVAKDVDSASMYRKLGRRAAQVASRLVLLCRRWEEPCAAGAIEGGLDRDAIFQAGSDPLRAVGFLDDLGPGDVALRSRQRAVDRENQPVNPR